MGPLYINARCKQILCILSAQTEPISVNRIAQAMGVSRRTVYYDVDKINLFLKQSKIPELENERDRGLLLPEESRSVILSLLQKDVEEQVYLFSPDERVKCMICCFVYSEQPVYIEHLTEYFGVSRNTIFADLKNVTQQLEVFDLKLDYKPKQGYRLEGDPVRVRALFMMYFNEMEPLFRSGSVPFFNQERAQEDYGKLKKIEESLGISYVDGVLFSIAALVPMLYLHRKRIYFENLKEDRVEKSKEFALVKTFFPDLPHEEQIYFSLHLLGSRVNMVPDEYFERASKIHIYDLTKEMVCEFQKVACIQFENKDELERVLFVHLSTSLYRYQFGIQIGNVLGEDIMKEYPELFSITKITMNNLRASLGVPIPDSEIAYLALHFGSFLKISEHDVDHLRILIVCVNGISTGNMLKREIQKLLPFVEIVDVVSAMSMMNPQKVCDLIISTIQINSVVPVITVNPILTDFDKRNILHHRLIASRQVEIQRDRLFNVVKKYVDPKFYENLHRDLTLYLQGDIDELDLEEEREMSLSDILTVDRIQIFEDNYSWRQSIRLSAKPLETSGCIESSYTDTIIEQLQYYGPYMFLTEKVILAHANPRDGVNEMGVSLGIFHNPVAFSTTRKAEIVFVLSAEDQEKHLRILQDILLLLNNESFLLQMQNCRTPEEALTVIRSVIQLEEQIS